MALIYKDGRYYDNETGKVYADKNALQPNTQYQGYANSPVSNIQELTQQAANWQEPAGLTINEVKGTEYQAPIWSRLMAGWDTSGYGASELSQLASGQMALPDWALYPPDPVQSTVQNAQQPTVYNPAFPEDQQPAQTATPTTVYNPAFPEDQQPAQTATPITATPTSTIPVQYDQTTPAGYTMTPTGLVANTVQATQQQTSPYSDLLNAVMLMLGQTGVTAQGSQEAFLPSSSTSELSQALQDRAMQMLNRGYGYTPEEETAIMERQLQRFTDDQAKNEANLINRYEQLGWRTGAPEMGGQAAGSLNDFYKNQELALADLTGQIGEYFASKRASDESSAVSQAMSINDQIYGQQRGDFADMLSLLNYEQGVSNDQFSKMMDVMQFMSDEEQRNFLNQQGINDRQVQDYYQQLATQWGMEIDAQNLEDSGLTQLMNYLASGEITSADYLNAMNWINSNQAGLYGQGTGVMANQDNGYLMLMSALAEMLGENGINLNTSTNVTTPDVTTTNTNEGIDLSWLSDLLGNIIGTVGDVATPDFSWLADLVGNLGSIDLDGNMSWIKGLLGADIDWANPESFLPALGNFLPSGASVTMGGKTYTIGKQGTTSANASGNTGVNEGEPTSGNETEAVSEGSKLLSWIAPTAIIGGMIYGIYNAAKDYSKSQYSEGGHARKWTEEALGHYNAPAAYTANWMIERYPELEKTTWGRVTIEEVVKIMDDTINRSDGNSMSNIMDMKVTIENMLTERFKNMSNWQGKEEEIAYMAADVVEDAMKGKEAVLYF